MPDVMMTRSSPGEPGVYMFQPLVSDQAPIAGCRSSSERQPRRALAGRSTQDMGSGALTMGFSSRTRARLTTARLCARRVTSRIMTIRGQKVILDADLARIYGVTTKRLNEQVKRNVDRFPDDFAFLVTPQELTHLRSQIATSNQPTRLFRAAPTEDLRMTACAEYLADLLL